jgi:hypothetical protein
MLVRTLACARTGRSAGTVMVANRFLGNPTDRDDKGGLRNRRCHGSRTEVPRETEGIATGPYRACAPHFYPNNLRHLRAEGPISPTEVSDRAPRQQKSSARADDAGFAVAGLQFAQGR